MKKTGEIVCVVVVLVLVGLLFWSMLTRPKEVVRVEHTTDTIVIRDTIREVVPEPYYVHVVRVDTVVVYKAVQGDTLALPVQIPIERKEYRTDDYFAVIEGFRPQLIRMELYPQVKYITNTETRIVTKRPRWGLGVQVGYGITPNKASPYIGVGIQYNLLTW